MEKVIIGYSRHDNLPSAYSGDYCTNARGIIDGVYEELKVKEDTCINTLYVELIETDWEKSEQKEAVYSLTINDSFILQFRINEFIKIADMRKIANKLDEIVRERIEADSSDESKEE